MLLGDLLKTPAKLCPDRIALIFRDREWTYAQLNAEVNRLSNALLFLDVRKGDRVAVLGRNSDTYVIIYFALAKIGAIMVPVNFWFKADEARYVIKQSTSRLLFFEIDKLTPMRPGRTIKKILPYFTRQGKTAPYGTSLYGLVQCFPATEPPIELSADDPHIILYTSGTTGFPKGATLTHRNHVLHAQALAEATNQREADRAPVIYPLFHTGGPDCVVLPHFLHCGTCVVLDSGDPQQILEAVERHQLTSIFCVPTVWRRILRQLSTLDTDHASRITPHVTRCLGSSDTFPPQLLNEIVEKFPNANFYQTYGLTEAGCILTVCKLTRDDRSKIDSVGKPLPCIDVRIVDDDDREVPRGAVGEVVANGETLMSGYWNDPERTMEAMKPIRMRMGERENRGMGEAVSPTLPLSHAPIQSVWLHSGDLARMDDDGYVYIAGRKKDVIISGGENIYPVEIERVLKQHPAIRDCAIVGVPDEEWGESVLAVVVREEGAEITADEVIAFVRERLAGFKKPRYVEFVEQLPVTSATGKMQRPELKSFFMSKYSH